MTEANIPLLWSSVPRGISLRDRRRQSTKMGELANTEERGKEMVDAMCGGGAVNMC